MNASGERRLHALLLLGLMVFFSTPRHWWHHCDGAEVHAMAGGGVVVHADDHCPICDQESAPLLAAATSPLLVQDVLVLDGPLCSIFGTPGDRAAEHPSRGPPPKG